MRQTAARKRRRSPPSSTATSLRSAQSLPPVCRVSSAAAVTRPGPRARPGSPPRTSCKISPQHRIESCRPRKHPQALWRRARAWSLLIASINPAGNVNKLSYVAKKHPCRAEGTDMFYQQLINGLMLGASYSLVAIGYTLIFGVLNLLYFSHGEVFMVGAFVGL